MFNIFSGIAPAYFREFYMINHGHKTRHSVNNYVLPVVRSYGASTFRSCGIRLWNELPNDIKLCRSKNAFKSKCNMFLSNKMTIAENTIFTI